MVPKGPVTTEWSALLHCIWVAPVSNLRMETSVLTEQTSWNLTWEPGGRGAQILSGRLLWQFSYIQRHLIFAPCHCSGTWNFEVAPTFLEKNFAPLPNSFSPHQDIPYIWCNPKVHNHVYKSPPLVCILSQISPVHILAFCFCKMSLVWTLSWQVYIFSVWQTAVPVLLIFISRMLPTVHWHGDDPHWVWACLAQCRGTAGLLLIEAADCCSSTYRLKTSSI